MLVKIIFRLSRSTAQVLLSAAIVAATALVAIGGPDSQKPMGLLWVAVTVLGGIAAAVIVHEASHLLACLGVGVPVRAVYIGTGKSPAIRFTVCGVRISVGYPWAGRVEFVAIQSKGRSSLILAAGSAADLIVAGALVAAYGLGQAVVFGIGLIMAAIGVANLLPYRPKNGRPSDGLRLLALLSGRLAAAERRLPEMPRRWLPSVLSDQAMLAELREMHRAPYAPLHPERTSMWLAACYNRKLMALLGVGFVGRALRHQGRTAELLALHANVAEPVGRFARHLTESLHTLEWEVLQVPDLPAAVIDLSAARAQWILNNSDYGAHAKFDRDSVRRTLALAQLRQRNAQPTESRSHLIPANPGRH